MPLVHQDTLRGGGGSGPSENRRPMSDFFATFDVLQSPPPAHVPAVNRRIKDCVGESWVWEEPRSPEAAQTPRALVPDACFPPKHPMAFASYSESAQPGGGGVTWTDDSNSHGLTDLVASLKAMGIPAPSSRMSNANGNTNGLENNIMESQWLVTVKNSPSRDERRLSRRASFCGALSSGLPSLSMCEGGVVRWSGVLPPRCTDPSAGYSSKVFLGGLPWDITESTLTHAFRQFNPVKVEWPGRDVSAGSSVSPRGFAYLTLESERRVRAVLAASRHDGHAWYYRVASRKHHAKDVEVIPWSVSDSNWVVGGSVRLEPGRTVFVGALHGMITAEALAHIMNDLFSGVVYAGIDTDKNKYPIGSGRVTFSNVRSYVRAISAGHIEIYTDKFTKKVQVDPYLEDSMCSVCNMHQGPYFCREPMCFRYFCRSCWAWQHPGGAHRALSRSQRHPHPHPLPDPPHSHSHSAFSASFTAPSDGTPSPSSSGASAGSVTSGSEPEPAPPDHAWALTAVSAAL